MIPSLWSISISQWYCHVNNQKADVAKILEQVLLDCSISAHLKSNSALFPQNYTLIVTSSPCKQPSPPKGTSENIKFILPYVMNVVVFLPPSFWISEKNKARGTHAVAWKAESKLWAAVFPLEPLEQPKQPSTRELH